VKLIIVSGLSGSGKTVALHALEDAGYYCVDNLHLGLLSAFVRQLMTPKLQLYETAAVGIDARSGIEELDRFGEIIDEIRGLGVNLQVIFLRADEEILLRRFSETRRKHPLARRGVPAGGGHPPGAQPAVEDRGARRSHRGHHADQRPPAHTP
jgi:RNase adapter protein RapZ